MLQNAKERLAFLEEKRKYQKQKLDELNQQIKETKQEIRDLEMKWNIFDVLKAISDCFK